MFSTKYSWAFIACILLLASCKRDTPLTEQQENTNKPSVTIDAQDLAVPAGFNFETEKTLNVKVRVADADPKQRYVIKIYGDVPASGKLISTGLTNASGEYSTMVRVPAQDEFIYIEKINADGSSKFEKVKANQFAAAVFNNSQPAPYVIRKSGSGMDCSTGCTITYNNPSANITVGAGEVACITGTISGSIDLTVTNGGIAKICAAGQFGEIKGDSNGKIYFLESSMAKISVQIVLYNGAEFKNWSDSLVCNGGDVVFVGGSGENHGIIYPYYSFHLFDGATYVNNGDIIASPSTSCGLIVWTQAQLTNNGKIKNLHSVTVQDHSTLTNNCLIETKYMLSTFKVINNSYIKISELFEQVPYGNGAPDPYTELNNGAQMTIKNIDFQAGEIKGIGSSRSKLKITANTSISTGASITGTTDICDTDGIETNNGTIQSPALASCAGYIATSTCNPEGFGSNSTQDTDNDGVADAQDEYPNDATRAFNSYYPNANTLATVAFEDLWPSKADFDFNDLSILFNIQQVLNANNEVVDYKMKLKVKAVGGSFKNGFGFRLDDIIPSEVSNVTGQVLVNNIITRSSNNTEAGQDRAVIIVYDTPEPTLHRVGGSMFNTVKTNQQGTSDTVFITIAFNSPIQSSKLAIDKFNPFIFTNQRRDYEVHLGNFKPTSLANTSLFGTFEDRTNVSNNTYYKNANGMPWAILIPAEFSHPKEKAPITSAYNFFDDWAISGGTSYTNWFTNDPGNQNSTNLY